MNSDDNQYPADPRLEPRKPEKRVLRYAVTALVGFIIVLAVSLPRGLLEAYNLNRVYRLLCDGFFTASVLFIGLGLITAVSSTGFFDVVGFAFLLLRSAFKADVRSDRPKDLYEYKQAKGANRHAIWFIAVVGLFFLAVAFVFDFLFVPVPL